MKSETHFPCPGVDQVESDRGIAWFAGSLFAFSMLCCGQNNLSNPIWAFHTEDFSRFCGFIGMGVGVARSTFEGFIGKPCPYDPSCNDSIASESRRDSGFSTPFPLIWFQYRKTAMRNLCQLVAGSASEGEAGIADFVERGLFNHRCLLDCLSSYLLS